MPHVKTTSMNIIVVFPMIFLKDEAIISLTFYSIK